MAAVWLAQLISAGTATHSWQDVLFSAPVAISPGQTYIASYFAPNADYAFEWDYFTNSSYTAGPITALQSAVGDGNGVFNYAGTLLIPDEQLPRHQLLGDAAVGLRLQRLLPARGQRRLERREGR